jgi:hypothetical protein
MRGSLVCLGLELSAPESHHCQQGLVTSGVTFSPKRCNSLICCGGSCPVSARDQPPRNPDTMPPPVWRRPPKLTTGGSPNPTRRDGRRTPIRSPAPAIDNQGVDRSQLARRRPTLICPDATTSRTLPWHNAQAPEELAALLELGVSRQAWPTSPHCDDRADRDNRSLSIRQGSKSPGDGASAELDGLWPPYNLIRIQELR